MKNELQELIAQGKTEQALEQLISLSEKPYYEDLREEVLLQSARYQEYAKAKRQGTSNLEEQQTSISKINEAVLHLISQLPDDLTSRVDSSVPKSSSKRIGKPWWQWVVGGGVIVGILGGIAEFSGYNLQSIFGSEVTAPLQLTVYVHGPKGPQDIIIEKEGKLIADFGNRRDTRQIGEDGRTNFGEIGRRFLGEAIGLFMEAEGYEVTYPDSIYIYKGEPIYLAVKPDSQLGIVQGKVRSRDGASFLSDVLIEVAGVTTSTDALGNFYLELPEEQWRNEYILYARKNGYQLKEEKYYPKLGEAEIRLTPQNVEK